jgi:hypothetical protein
MQATDTNPSESFGPRASALSLTSTMGITLTERIKVSLYYIASKNDKRAIEGHLASRVI